MRRAFLLPFAGYPDFEACVMDNAAKADPSAYCAALEKAVKSDMVEPHKRVIGVEIFSTGEKTDSEGRLLEVTADDLDAIVEAFNAGVPEMVPVKFGHTSPGFNAEVVAERMNVPVGLITGEDGGGDGQIWPGHIAKLERKQNKLVADFDLLAPVADMIAEGLFRSDSAEIIGGYRGYSMVLSGLALLGAERPAVKDLAPLQAATIMHEGKQPVAYAFAMQPTPQFILEDRAGRRVAMATETNMVSDHDNLRGDLDIAGIEIDLESAIKGRPGAKTIRQAWERFKSSILKGQAKHTEARIDMVTEKELRETLEIADDDDIIQAVASLVEAKAKRSAGDSAEFTESRFAEEIKKRDDEITELRRAGRIAHFSSEVSGLSIEGKPSDLAETLVRTEETMGADEAVARLEEWRKLDAANTASGVFRSLGRTGDGAAPTPIQEWDRVVEDYKASHPDVPEAAALKAVMASEPSAYAAYYQETRRVRN